MKALSFLNSVLSFGSPTRPHTKFVGSTADFLDGKVCVEGDWDYCTSTNGSTWNHRTWRIWSSLIQRWHSALWCKCFKCWCSPSCTHFGGVPVISRPKNVCKLQHCVPHCILFSDPILFFLICSTYNFACLRNQQFNLTIT